MTRGRHTRLGPGLPDQGAGRFPLRRRPISLYDGLVGWGPVAPRTLRAPIHAGASPRDGKVDPNDRPALDFRPAPGRQVSMTAAPSMPTPPCFKRQTVSSTTKADRLQTPSRLSARARLPAPGKHRPSRRKDRRLTRSPSAQRTSKSLFPYDIARAIVMGLGPGAPCRKVNYDLNILPSGAVRHRAPTSSTRSRHTSGSNSSRIPTTGTPSASPSTTGSCCCPMPEASTAPWRALLTGAGRFHRGAGEPTCSTASRRQR